MRVRTRSMRRARPLRLRRPVEARLFAPRATVDRETEAAILKQVRRADGETLLLRALSARSPQTKPLAQLQKCQQLARTRAFRTLADALVVRAHPLHTPHRPSA